MRQHLSLTRFKNGNGSSTRNAPDVNTAPAAADQQSLGRNGSLALSLMDSRTSLPASSSSSKTDKGSGLVLKVQVLRGRNLAPKDKSGTSDPFLVLNFGDSKQATSTVNKTLNPEWNQSLDFPITVTDSPLLEAICWDKDRFRNDYMGEFDVLLDEVFTNGSVTSGERWIALEGRRSGRKKKKDSNVTGEVLLNFSLHDSSTPSASSRQIYQKFQTAVSQANGEAGDDDDEEASSQMRTHIDDVDEGSEDDDDDDFDDEEEDEADGARTPCGANEEKTKRRRRMKLKRLRRKKNLRAYQLNEASETAGVLYLEINRITDLPPEKNSTRTTFDMDPFVVTSMGKKTYRTKVVNHNLNPVYDEKLVFSVGKHEVNYSLQFAVVDRDKFSGNDFVGTVPFPIDSVAKLAPKSDPTTGLYRLPDPDTVCEEPSERKKKFRLPISRNGSQHNLSRDSSSASLSRLTRSASSNSLNQRGPSPVRPRLVQQKSDPDVLRNVRSAALTSAPTYEATNSDSNLPSLQPSRSNSDSHSDSGLKPFELPLELQNKQRWQGKHHPKLYIKAKYMPYRALRQQFWRAMLKQYDADESGTIDKVELMTMLETLGSTLQMSTIEGFFTRWKDENSGLKGASGDQVLTLDQAVICLEEQLMKPRGSQGHRSPRAPSQHSSYLSHGQSASVANSSSEASPSATTPPVELADQKVEPPINLGAPVPAVEVSDLSDQDALPSMPGTPLVRPAPPESSGFARPDSWGHELEADMGDADESSKEEHVVEIRECPICHMPRLDRGRKKNGRRRAATDADIITHIATCASSDWRAVNNVVMAGFVTSSQAQRKWYSKVVTKISYGGYRLGANSANILVQDRRTGALPCLHD